MSDQFAGQDEPVEDDLRAELDQIDLGEVDDPRIVGAVEALRNLGELPVDEHPQLFEQVHGALRSALAGGSAHGSA